MPERAVRKACQTCEIIVSTALLHEYREVPLALEFSGKITHDQAKALIAGIATVVSQSTLVRPEQGTPRCRDPKDDMVLDCCLAGVADYLITGDKDLLDRSVTAAKTRIMTPAGYLKMG